MRLDYVYLVFVTYFVQLSEGGGGHKKHVHVKINVPILVHKHKHIITVYKKPHKVEPKKHIVIHKHIHNHGHNHGHKHKHKHDHKAKVDAKHDHKHKHKHDHKHKHKHSKPHGHNDHGYHEHHGHHGHNDHGYHEHHGHHGHKGHGYHGHHQHYENKDNEYELPHNPGISGNYFDDDGFTGAKKSLKTEHIEVTHVDPLATDPRDRLKVRGSYKVQESDPYDITTTSYQAYDSPFGKEIAKKLTNFRENIKENDDEAPEGINNYENYDDGAEDLENLIVTPEDENNNIGYYQGREKSEHYITNERYK